MEGYNTDQCVTLDFLISLALIARFSGVPYMLTEEDTYKGYTLTKAPLSSPMLGK